MRVSSVFVSCAVLLSSVTLTPNVSRAQDCDAPVVSLGEVMAGLQAGFTGGTHTMEGLPEGFLIAALSEERRGFIVPETEVPSTQCDNDFILIGEWFSCNVSRTLNDGTVLTFRTRNEARECVDSGFFGLILGFKLQVDGIEVSIIETATKIGALPDFPGSQEGTTVSAFSTAGHIIAPCTLPIGPHSATAVFEFDFDRDGNVDIVNELTADFEIVGSGNCDP